jgi:subtilisin family serine protease
MADRYIVKYKSGSTNNLSRRAVSRTKVGDVEVITLSEKINPATFADELRASGAEQYIEYIQPDVTLQLAGVETEETYEYPEDDAEDTELPETGGDSPVIVAIIDTGIYSSHPMLNGFMVEGWNFTNNTNITYDPSFPSASAHGTHVAGIIAQVAHEAGADIQILPLQVFDNGIAYTSDILAAIEYALEQGASIINCSFGSIHENPALFDAISSADALFICAVGNNRRDLDVTPSFPASYRLPNLISVGFTGWYTQSGILPSMFYTVSMPPHLNLRMTLSSTSRVLELDSSFVLVPSLLPNMPPINQTDIVWEIVPISGTDVVSINGGFGPINTKTGHTVTVIGENQGIARITATVTIGRLVLTQSCTVTVVDLQLPATMVVERGVPFTMEATTLPGGIVPTSISFVPATNAISLVGNPIRGNVSRAQMIGNTVCLSMKGK